jgi:uncharacterized LabA/DUF88 family protein
MEKKGKENNFAFIDSQNLNLSIQSLGWKLDFSRFRKYLQDKYFISKAYLFIGYVSGNELLYAYLQDAGYICIFKPTLELSSGRIKGNIDTELVLHTMIEIKHFNQAVLVTGDGDFFCLVQYLKKQGKLYKVLIPNQHRYSILLKRLSTPDHNILDFMNTLQDKVGIFSK